MNWSINLQNATPASAREMVNSDVFPVAEKTAPTYAKKECLRLRTTMLAVVDALPKQGLLVSFHGGAEIHEDGRNNGQLGWSTTVVPKNLYSMYTW